MNLHNEILNLQTDKLEEYYFGSEGEAAYKCGHRDARHAAAELALKAEARIEELESIIQGTIDCLSVLGDAEGLADFVIENLSRVFKK